MTLLSVIMTTGPAPGAGFSYVNFGEETVGADTFPTNDGRCLASPFVAPETGNVISITANFDAMETTEASMKLVLMDDASGTPGNVLAVSSALTVTDAGGWVGGSITPTGVTASATYWLGIVCNAFDIVMKKRSGTPGTSKMANGTFSYATPPSTWPGTDATYGGQMCVYATIEY